MGMTKLDITHGNFRLVAIPGEDGLDTITVTNVLTEQPATVEEAKLRRMQFLHGEDGWRRVPRQVTLDLEATLMAFNGRPTTMSDLMRVNDIVMP